MKGARMEVWDPLGQSQKTTKVGWMAEVSESRADRLPCRSLCALVGPSKQILKNLEKFTKIYKVVKFKLVKIQTLDPCITQITKLQSLLKILDYTI